MTCNIFQLFCFFFFFFYFFYFRLEGARSHVQDYSDIQCVGGTYKYRSLLSSSFPLLPLFFSLNT